MGTRTRLVFLRWGSLLIVAFALSACGAGVATEPKDPAGGKALPTPTPVKTSPSTPTPTPVSKPTPTPAPTPPPGPDTTRPTVSSVNPPDTAMGANLNAIIAIFYKALKIDSATSSSFVVGGPQGPVSGTLLVNKDGKTVIFTPSTPLEFGTRYTAKLTTEIQDVAGNFMGQDFIWHFNTGKQLALHSYGNHTCARLRNGMLKCWGYNEFGQLGQGDTQNRGDTLNEMGTKLLPVNLGIGRSVVQVVAGTDHTCARLDNLQVKCWGENVRGQLGIDSQVRRGIVPEDMGEGNAAIPPVNLGTGRYALELVAGFGYTCARLDNGGVKCWGNGLALGLGGSESRGDDTPPNPSEMGDALPYLDLGTNRKALTLYAGWLHTCARLIDTSRPYDTPVTKCWGQNPHGQLGLGNTESLGSTPSQMGNNLPVVDLGSFRFAQQLSLGEAHTCAVLDSGNVKCWGRGNRGQLGQGSTVSLGNALQQMGNDLPMVDLGTNRIALEISAGAEHTCARLDDGSTKCWGSNSAGQLGIGAADDRGDNPAEMGDLLPAVNFGRDNLGAPLQAVELVSGYAHNCAKLDNNAIKCWGSNTSGRLGVGDTLSRGSLPSEMGDALQAVDLGAP